jgi:hypothetical protein
MDQGRVTAAAEVGAPSAPDHDSTSRHDTATDHDTATHHQLGH